MDEKRVFALVFFLFFMFFSLRLVIKDTNCSLDATEYSHLKENEFWFLSNNINGTLLLSSWFNCLVTLSWLLSAATVWKIQLIISGGLTACDTFEVWSKHLSEVINQKSIFFFLIEFHINRGWHWHGTNTLISAGVKCIVPEKQNYMLSERLKGNQTNVLYVLSQVKNCALILTNSLRQ